MERSGRRARVWGTLLGFVLVPLLPVFLCSCGSKDEAPKDASYYKGPLQPRSERMKNAKTRGE
jgi:hypothetical protein